jgi:hypothetical protein
MQIRLKMRFSCAFPPLTIFHDRRSIRPDSANIANPAGSAIPIPEIHKLISPLVFLALAESTIAAIYVSCSKKIGDLGR